jgi:hypothetical protein
MGKTMLILAALMAAPVLLFASSITVTSPAAGQEWIQGGTYMITWTKSGDMQPTAAIRLRRAGSPETEDAAVAIANGTDNDGSYEWTVPLSVAAGDYFIRVRTDDSTVIGDSANFRVVSSGSITVSEPHATAVYMARSSMPIVWTSSGIVGDVRIELENATTRSLITVSASRPYNGSPLDYVIPDSVPEAGYRVKISQGGVVGYSGYIGILAWREPDPALIVTEPNGGETLYQGGHAAVRWNPRDITASHVRIELLKGGRLHSLLAEAQNTSSCYFYWGNILHSKDLVKHMTGTDFKIRITTSDGRYVDTSDANFSILGPPGVWVFAPAAGAVWDEDSIQEIRWNAQGLEGRTVKIILKFTSGSPLNVRTIASGIPAMDKRSSWTVMTLEDRVWNLSPGSYPGAVISVVTEGSGSFSSSSSKEFTIRKR